MRVSGVGTSREPAGIFQGNIVPKKGPEKQGKSLFFINFILFHINIL
jgi:hypothetical protein